MVRTWPTAVVIVTLAGLCASCSNDNAAVTDARAACGIANPVLPGQASAQTAGQNLSGYRVAQTYSARATAADPRWGKLNDAIGTLITAWATIVDAAGPDYVNSGGVTATSRLGVAIEQYGSSAAAAERTVRSECAVAQTGS